MDEKAVKFFVYDGEDNSYNEFFSETEAIKFASSILEEYEADDYADEVLGGLKVGIVTHQEIKFKLEKL